MITSLPDHRGERGQILVLFTVAIVSIIAMVGLVLDAGSTFAQRRSQQNAADAAALAAADTYLVTSDEGQATAAAQASAASNGFAAGPGGTTVDVSYDLTNGARVTVTIGARHANFFTPIVGIQGWDVATTASAVAGFPDTAAGASPFIGSIDVFDNNGDPLRQYSDPANPYGFGDGNGDVPNNAGDTAWTNYGIGNVDTSQVDGIIQGSLIISKTLAYGDYIGQHNSGNHNFLYTDIQTYLAGKDVPVPIVDHNGNFQGWAMFHITSASGGSDKKIYGYYEANFTSPSLSVGSCSLGACPRFLGSYVLKLVN
jgi:Flp pilus assembly protein TadG